MASASPPLTHNLRAALDAAAVWIAGAGMVVGVLLPRTLAVIFFLFCGAILLRVPLLDERLDFSELFRDRVTRALLAFYGFALLSFAWAYDPKLAVTNGFFGIVTSFTAISTFRILSRAPILFLSVAHAAKIAVMISAAALLLDMATNEQIRSAIGLSLGFARAATYTMNGGEIADLTRGLSVLLLFYIAANAYTLSSHSSRSDHRVAIGLGVLVAAAVFLGVSQTAQLTAVVALAVFTISRLAPKPAAAILAAGWLAASLLIVPLALWAKSSAPVGEELATAPLLRNASPGARLDILNAYAIRIRQAPILGQGAASSRVLGPILDRELMHQHPHNTYMQVWYELGFVGAVLFALSGLVILKPIVQLSLRPASTAMTGFAAIAAVIAPSYGMWESWFVEVIAFTAVLIGAGAVISENSESKVPKTSAS